MTSKEALEIIVRKHCVSNTDKEDEELEKCYKCVMPDLEVLEALKEIYSGAIERENHLMLTNMDLVDARDLKVKEWLERKKNGHD